MVELTQHAATDRRGKRHVYDLDRVTAEVDGVRRHVGFVARRDGVQFVATVALTDVEKDAIVEGINAARKAEGRFGPIDGAGPGPSQTERVRDALEEIEEEGDE